MGLPFGYGDTLLSLSIYTRLICIHTSCTGLRRVTCTTCFSIPTSVASVVVLVYFSLQLQITYATIDRLDRSSDRREIPAFPSTMLPTPIGHQKECDESIGGDGVLRKCQREERRRWRLHSPLTGPTQIRILELCYDSHLGTFFFFT